MNMLLEGVDMPKGTNMMLLISPEGEVWEMGDLLGNDKLIDGAKAVPAADVRPVVFCRDCKFAPIGDKDGNDLEWPFNEFDANPCPYKCLDNWHSHKPASDFFCAAGEKREES